MSGSVPTACPPGAALQSSYAAALKPFSSALACSEGISKGLRGATVWSFRCGSPLGTMALPGEVYVNSILKTPRKSRKLLFRVTYHNTWPVKIPVKIGFCSSIVSDFSKREMEHSFVPSVHPPLLGSAVRKARRLGGGLQVVQNECQELLVRNLAQHIPLPRKPEGGAPIPLEAPHIRVGPKKMGSAQHAGQTAGHELLVLNASDGLRTWLQVRDVGVETCRKPSPGFDNQHHMLLLMHGEEA